MEAMKTTPFPFIDKYFKSCDEKNETKAEEKLRKAYIDVRGSNFTNQNFYLIDIYREGPKSNGFLEKYSKNAQSQDITYYLKENTNFYLELFDYFFSKEEENKKILDKKIDDMSLEELLILCIPDDLKQKRIIKISESLGCLRTGNMVVLNYPSLYCRMMLSYLGDIGILQKKR